MAVGWGAAWERGEREGREQGWGRKGSQYSTSKLEKAEILSQLHPACGEEAPMNQFVKIGTFLFKTRIAKGYPQMGGATEHKCCWVINWDKGQRLEAGEWVTDSKDDDEH